MNFIMKKNKGFSLIELMMVITIIGILSAIIYVSISGAKAKAANENAKQGLSTAIVQAKLYYFANGESFDGVCDLSSPVGGVKSISDILLNAAKSTAVGDKYNSINLGAGSWEMTTCYDGSSYWVAQVPLRGSTVSKPKMFCADSKGVQKEQNQVLAEGDNDCK